ncbi:NuoI/complex I 23 kDa subunit family protein [Vulcanisaeta thermophila]|uniref:NuoI/complex I 23 kDa subunit family protein n=1 Tax=Vulcanisaeta thermophila TaxID=867917 RepID=UPI00085291D0|nr:NADH-quinone oxidoreductase subunit I [Vulcanisaeta thermophila]
MVIKIREPRGTLAEDIALHVRALITGFKEAIEPNRMTIQYPYETRWIPERFRGWIFLDIKRCISCFQCAWACPVNAIQMYRAPNGKWYPGIRYTQCILCHFCVDACPVNALQPTPIHDIAYVDFDEVKFRPEDMSKTPEYVYDEVRRVIKYDIRNGKLIKVALPKEELTRRLRELDELIEKGEAPAGGGSEGG